jgi:short-subunit dehydrogenase
MAKKSEAFTEKYGPWALIAGASVGLGAAFATELAEKGLNIVVIARKAEPLQSLAAELTSKYGIEVRTISTDLASPDMLKSITAETDDLEIGLMVYNTAYMLIGSFFEHPLENQLRQIDVNCRGPLTLAYHFGHKMRERRRGGIVLMTSLSGLQGAPWLATYGATKAFNLVLGEGLWYELKDKGVDVLACCAGAISTPNYQASEPEDLGLFAPNPLPPEKVAHAAIAALGKKSSVVPGFAYRLSHFLTSRFMTRKQVIKIMGNSTEKMYGDRNLAIN